MYSGVNSNVRKLCMVVFILFHQALLAFNYTIKNNTAHKIYAIIDTISWPNYEQEIEAGKSWNFNTLACARKVMVRGQEGPIKGLYQQAEIPGSGCKSHTLEVEAQEFYTDPITQQKRARYLEIDFT